MSLLEKLKINETLRFELNGDPSDLEAFLRTKVDPEKSTTSGRLLYTLSSPFSDTGNVLFGKIESDSFRVKKIREVGEQSNGMATAYGAFHGSNNQIVLKVKIIGFKPNLILLNLIIMGMFFLLLGVILAAGNSEVVTAVWTVVGVFMLFFLFVPFLAMRIGTRKLRNRLLDLFKEFQKSKVSI